MPRFLGTALLAVVSTLAALAIAELGVRVLRLAPGVKAVWISDASHAYKRSSNPIMGFELKPNYRNDNPDFIQGYPSTNSHGQRDVERSLEKPPGVRRILLLGDSVVEGIGIRDLDDTISRQLESLYPEGRTEVLNFGVSSYCTKAEVALLEEKGLEFRPDVVVLIFVRNDYENFNSEAFQLGAIVERPAAVKHLFVGSDLFRLLSIRLNWFQFGDESDPAAWNRRAVGNNNVVDGLARLRELSEAHGFELWLVVWPEFTEREIRDVYFMPGGEGELVVERLARMNGIPAARLSPYFREDLEAQPGPVNVRRHYTIGDTLHPSPVGTRVAAEALKRILEQEVADRRPGDDDPAAVAAARAVGKNDPDYSRVHNNIGVSRQKAGELEEAVEHFQKALQIDPDLAEAHHNLGVTLVKLGRPEAALPHLQRMIELKPYTIDAYVTLATSLERLGRTRQAQASYRGALRENPDLWQAANNLAWSLATSPDSKLRGGTEALRWATHAAELTGHANPGVLDTLAAAHAETGQFEAAIAVAEKATELARAAGQSELATQLEGRLQLYRIGWPFRQGKQPPAGKAAADRRS
jgi:tetratricopeptide (TPR) repeat protein